MKLIKFKQNNCTPCKMLENFLTDSKVDADETINLSLGEERSIQLAEEHSVMTTPTLLLLDDDGIEIDRVVGVGQTKVRRILTERGLI